ncbi:hypothetical protein [Nocardia carnea]|uniref:hypothetical protein n=1 Tax=Nocardia carnea TaxID=37328 RepID=UPI0024569623|nr:hypothetical protein [Nocardia carnea]
MRRPICRRTIATLGAFAVLAVPAVATTAPAVAQPSYYAPEITPCDHLFRSPLDAPRPGAATFWSPYGATGIVCYDNGTGMADYYQRDPRGAWHDMNELIPGHFFFSVFTTGIPDAAQWR